MGAAGGPRLGVPGAGAPSRRRRACRGGFTLIEMLMAAAIVGILAGLAIPNVRTMVLRARAVELQGDLDVVRVAALNYHAEHLAWPGESSEGDVPSGLSEFLPDGFSFAGDGYALDFENWSLPSGLPGDPSARSLVGVSVTTEDPALGNALVELLGPAIVFSVDDTHTVVIDRS